MFCAWGIFLSAIIQQTRQYNASNLMLIVINLLKQKQKSDSALLTHAYIEYNYPFSQIKSSKGFWHLKFIRISLYTLDIFYSSRILLKKS